MKRRALLGLLFLSLFSGHQAFAQEALDNNSESWTRLVLGAKVGFGSRDRDSTYRLYLSFLVEQRDWLISFQAPLYGIITDNGSPTPHYGGMGLLKAHWDEVGDVGRVINEIRLGREDGPARLSLGRVSGYSFGRGSLLDNLYSQINPDDSGLTLGFDFRSRQGHTLSVMVVEPFNPVLVGLSGTVHPLAPWFYKKNPTVSALAVNFSAFVDPTIVGVAVNYGLGVEIEQSFFVKKVFITPYNSYSLTAGRSSFGAGFIIGRTDIKDPLSWKLSLNLQLMMGEFDGQAVGSLYLLERRYYPLVSTLVDNYPKAIDAYPDEWHGSIKTKLEYALPGRFLARYTLLVNPVVSQHSHELMVQGTFFNRWTLGSFILGKKYGTQAVAVNSDISPWLWLANLETAVNIWQGLTISGNYSYMITSESSEIGHPIHQFMISLGYEWGRLFRKTNP